MCLPKSVKEQRKKDGQPRILQTPISAYLVRAASFPWPQHYHSRSDDAVGIVDHCNLISDASSIAK